MTPPQGKWSLNTDFNGVRRVHICTLCTPYVHCKIRISPCKSVVIPWYHRGLPWYHYGLTQTFATCVRCAHGVNTDSFNPVEVRTHGPFSLCTQPNSKEKCPSPPYILFFMGLHMLLLLHAISPCFAAWMPCFYTYWHFHPYILK